MFKGSVYSRKWIYNGKKHKAWGIRYSANGGAVKRAIVADTKEGAQAELDKKRDDYQRRLLGTSEGKTLADLAPVFLAHKANQGRAMEPIRIRVENNLVPYFGKLALEEIDAEAIDEYIQTRKADSVMNATINRDLAVLRHMLRMAVRKWRWLRQEPYIELLPESGPRDRELGEAEEAKLLPFCQKDFRALVQAARYTGMRQGELLKLTWGQVDLVNRTLDFPPTKRGRKRLVPIAEPLYYVLMRLRGTCGHKDLDHVFSRADGTPWNKLAVELRLVNAVKAAGIPAIRFHDLRHTIASRLKRRGVHETEIQRLLGHKSLQMTDRYINVEVEQLRTALSVLSISSTNLTQENAAELSLSGKSLN
jgi:integrase